MKRSELKALIKECIQELTETDLTKKNVKVGLTVINKQHPDWGKWNIKQDRNGWIVQKAGRSGANSKMLDVGEFKFWKLA